MVPSAPSHLLDHIAVMPADGTSTFLHHGARGRVTLEDVVLGWPDDEPMAIATWSSAPAGEAVQRAEPTWSYIAHPQATFRSTLVDPARGCARSMWVDSATGEALGPPVVFTDDPLADLERLVAALRGTFTGVSDLANGGWIGGLSYTLGRVLEPRAGHNAGPGPAGAKRRRDWPLIEFHYCPGGYLFEHATGRLEVVGDAKAIPALGRAERGHQFTVGKTEGQPALAYQQGVERIVQHIAAGDVYQVNLAHQLKMGFTGSMRRAFLDLFKTAQPWHSAYMELAPGWRGEARCAIVSMSPELFLSLEPGEEGQVVTTRPMKGTRPAPPRGDAEELRCHPKDRAELTMIVDLMRNDLGRICRPGSVRVTALRTIEHHGGGHGGDEQGGVLQATATIRGLLRERAGLADLLRAAFPPGSVTGAPRIRAMQIIDELEEEPRGLYCGSVGWIARPRPGEEHLRASFNVAIRTAMIEGTSADAKTCHRLRSGELLYSVGAGIVADSDPLMEWQETLDKAGILNGLRGP